MYKGTEVYPVQGTAESSEWLKWKGVGVGAGGRVGTAGWGQTVGALDSLLTIVLVFSDRKWRASKNLSGEIAKSNRGLDALEAEGQVKWKRGKTRRMITQPRTERPALWPC